MSELCIDLPPRSDYSAVLQLIDEHLTLVQRPLGSAGPARFEVEEGSYLLRVLWSGGQRTQQAVEVPSTGTIVYLELPLLDSELSLVDAPFVVAPVGRIARGIGLVTNNRRVPAPRLGGEGRGALGDRPDHKVTEMVLQGTLPPELQLWRRIDGSWEPQQSNMVQKPVAGGFNVSVTVGDELHLVELRSGNARLFLSLPAEHSIISIRWLLERPTVYYIDAEAHTSDQNVEALQRYIQSGEIAVARTMAPEILAERFLAGKRSAPRIAALGAYVLLRAGEFERLHDWPDNLTSWKPWLPDGPVIAAWQRLRADTPDYEKAFELLMEAVRRGLPTYIEGVRLLKDGLDLFANDDEKDWDVAGALATIDHYGKAMRWNKLVTTYFGDGPDEPRLGARLD